MGQSPTAVGTTAGIMPPCYFPAAFFHYALILLVELTGIETVTS
jgi:hypothetical protein